MTIDFWQRVIWIADMLCTKPCAERDDLKKQQHHLQMQMLKSVQPKIDNFKVSVSWRRTPNVYSFSITLSDSEYA